MISAIIMYVGLNIIHNEVSDLIGKQEKNASVARKIKHYILKNESIEKVESQNIIKFGQTYLVICAIYFKDNISLKKADEERNKLEKEVKEKYSFINTIILKMHYQKEDK